MRLVSAEESISLDNDKYRHVILLCNRFLSSCRTFSRCGENKRGRGRGKKRGGGERINHNWSYSALEYPLPLCTSFLWLGRQSNVVWSIEWMMCNPLCHGAGQARPSEAWSRGQYRSDNLQYSHKALVNIMRLNNCVGGPGIKSLKGGSCGPWIRSYGDTFAPSHSREPAWQYRVICRPH